MSDPLMIDLFAGLGPDRENTARAGAAHRRLLEADRMNTEIVSLAPGPSIAIRLITSCESIAAGIVSLVPGPTGGLDVPEDAFKLVFELLSRDLTLKQDGEKLIVSGPNGAKPDLSPAEVERIKKYKFHLLSLLAYVPPERTW